MRLEQILFAFYVFLPFAAALLPNRVIGRMPVSVWTTGLRIVALLLLLRPVVGAADFISLSAILADGYPIGLVLSVNPARLGLLLTAEFCFLLAHWMCVASAEAAIVFTFISLAQGLYSLFVLSNNAVSTGGLQMIAGAVFFYLVRFSIDEKRQAMAELISRRIYILYFLLGLLLIVWGITEFGERDLLFGKSLGSHFGQPIWLLLMLLAVPLPPWSRWFGYAVENLPEGVTVVVVTFFSAVALKFASLFSVVYPDIGWKPKLALYLLGIVGCAFSIAGLFAAESRRRMLGSLPSFFFSLILVSVGVSKSTLVLSAYFVCLFLPVFTGLALYASTMKVSSSLQKVLVGFLFALILGVPGTPVYQIFSGIGARSLAMGISYALLFGLIWFFYFCANVHICRKIFVDEQPPELGANSRLGELPASFTGYCVFLMVFIVVATQVAGVLL
jgi:hypothetical protein